MTSKYDLCISERFELISKQKNHSDKIKLIQLYGDKNFLELLDFYLDSSVVFLDPNDNMEYKTITEPGLNFNVRLDQEIKNLNLFTNKTKYPNMTKEKRDKIYKEIIESIHPKDAILIENLRKTKKLPYKLKPEPFIEAFPSKVNWNG